MTSEQKNRNPPKGELGADVTDSGPNAERRMDIVLTLRIPKRLIYVGASVTAVGYVAALFWTGFSMRYFSETSGPPKTYELKVIKFGCVERLGKEYAVPQELSRELRRGRLYWLDDTYVAHNSRAILDDPICLGARISDLMHKPGPVRYYVVDTDSKAVLLEVIKKE